MRRAAIIAAYAIGGILVAATLAWASYAVAGARLSTPADPIRPVGVVERHRNAAEHEGSPAPTPHHRHHAGATRTTAPPVIAPSPGSPPPTAATGPPHAATSPSPGGERDDNGGGGHRDD